jgi:formate C-acetyltransferase
VLAGRNTFSLLNDDVIIPACVRAGKTKREARLYVNGGCQETIVEGVEHSAGAYYYFNMPRVLDLCLQPAPAMPGAVRSPEAARVAPRVIQDAATFEAFYGQFMAILKRLIAKGAEWRRLAGAQWSEIHPCPWFSATLSGCLEQGRDYTAGGATHNASGLALVGLATLVDSLYAIAKAVYEERWLSLEDLHQVLAQNWHDHAALRARMVGLPKFGHGNAEVDALAARIAAEMGAFARTLINERGGRFQSSFFVYYVFVEMGKYVRATPDGRLAGSVLSQGVGPAHLNPPDSLTDVFRSLSALDLRDHPANAVLDTQLPFGGAMPPDTFVALMRTFAQMGGATLQPNVVSLATLKDAQSHPSRYHALTVRICGLSARFVSLDRVVQDEIIQRHSFAAF